MILNYYLTTAAGPSNGNIIHPGTIKIERRRTVSTKKDEQYRNNNVADTNNVSVITVHLVIII